MNWFIDLIRRFLSLFQKPVIPTSHVKLPVASGSTIFIPTIINNQSSDWTAYLTQPFGNQNANGLFDEDNCVTQAGLNGVVEPILNYALKNDLLPKPLSDFLKDPQWGYINESGYIDLSTRFSSTMNGTTEAGLGMDTFWLCLNRDGFVSRKLWPDPEGLFTREQYYTRPPDGVIKAGKLAAAIFQWSWQVIVNNNWNYPNLELIKETLKTSPIHWAGMCCSQDHNGIERWCYANYYVHSRQIYNIDNYIEVLDSELPALKKLELIFPIPTMIKASLNIT